MLDPRLLYSLREDVLAKLADQRPVLIHQFDGFVDAGQAGRLFSTHLLEQLDHEILAEFDHDQLHDYRSRRPAMVFDTNTWKSYADVTLRLYRMVDEHGEVFLLLTGPEPDVQWERLAAAIIALIEQIGVRLTISIHGIPMAVPHTRPVSVTAHATDQSLLGDRESWLQRVQVPASVANLLEFRLGRSGHDAMGYAAHVPHYLAQTTYPAAAELLLDSVSASTGLALPTGALREAAALVRDEVDKQVADDEQAGRLVVSLEQQYDAFLRGRKSNLLADANGPLPTAEELGAELERFLAEQSRDTEN